MHELEILKSIYAAKSTHSQVTIAPGDDMGEVRVGNQRVLCSVDQLVIGRHVTPRTNPSLIGRKAIARCFSDIAAMCAVPVGSLFTACVPTTTDNAWCQAVFAGANEVAQKWGGPIFGGDIASSEGPAIFTVTAIATPGSRTIKRTGAEDGDYICVTGELGNSIAGHHISFTPRIAEAQELLKVLGDNLHSMIDISDGLGQDASHLATQELQLVIDTTLLPLRKGATVDNAISDGEDYELLFTSSTKPPEELATVIGRVESGTNKVITLDGSIIANCGWNHQ
ncbi:MAG: thiamine-monophosphate kinase [Phycisphaerales bacterium]|nr:thiamine-monophosphate kinase [Planctomycetota bacterium]MBL6997931.1 thiamine-monophosphate kinase [Phycisphaerales bacterium]